MGKAKKVLRVLTIIAGTLLLVLAIARIIKIMDLTFSEALLSFYMIIFSLIIVLTELGIAAIINLFSFEKTFIGRGLFLIFVGILCFDQVDNLHSFIGTFGLIIGIILVVYGAILTAIGFTKTEPIDTPVFSRKK